jgi:2-hydroxy-7-methoxy-5-methyl-1-naphthoate---CoA ligase
MTRPTSEGVIPWPEDAARQYRAEGRWGGRTLTDAVHETVIAKPDAIALVDGGTRMTYAELWERAEAGAGRLLDLGLRPDDRVVVQLPNSWHFVVFLLASLRAGIVPVMALPAHRSTELSAIAQVSEARAIVVPDEVRGFDHRVLAHEIALECPALEHILVSGQAAEGQTALDGLLANGASRGELGSPCSSDVALFLLSGGTTGLPKLIARTHDDYEYNARECARTSRIDDATVYLVTLPAGHNFPLACPGILGVLLTGGRVVLLSSPEPKRAFTTIAAEGVTITAAVPAVAQRWIDHADEVGAEDLSSLRVLQVGGSRMPDEVAARVRPVLGCTLQQVFGMAEGLINMTRLDDPEEVILTTQGRPVCDADEIRVVDPFGLDVPAGERGLILTKGPYTPCGYYRAPEANERSFIDGWYSSGDIVEQRADGNLVVHGRDKDLINRGGEKISAEEIESLAYRIPGVELAAVVAYPDRVFGERVCLVVVVKEGVDLTLEEVRCTMLASGIAAFKLPERLELVEEIPMTKVGKIDKRTLRVEVAEHVTTAESKR